MPLDMEGVDGGASSLAAVSRLQPLIRPANIIAAYAMNEPAGPCNTDRSGNGLNFGASGSDILASELANVADLIPGKAAVLQGGSQIYATCPQTCRKYSQNFALYGELTIMFRLWVLAPYDAAAHTVVYGNAQDTTNGSCAFDLGFQDQHKLTFYQERLKAGIGFKSSLVCVPNTWLFVGARRYASGTLRLSLARGVRGGTISHQDSGALQLPQTSVSTTYSVSFGATHWGAQQASSAWADMMIMNTAITDDEFASQAATAMRGCVA